MKRLLVFVLFFGFIVSQSFAYGAGNSWRWKRFLLHCLEVEYTEFVDEGRVLDREAAVQNAAAIAIEQGFFGDVLRRGFSYLNLFYGFLLRDRRLIVFDAINREPRFEVKIEGDEPLEGAKLEVLVGNDGDSAIVLAGSKRFYFSSSVPLEHPFEP